MKLYYVTEEELDDGGIIWVTEGENSWPIDISTAELESIALKYSPEYLFSFNGAKHRDPPEAT